MRSLLRRVCPLMSGAASPATSAPPAQRSIGMPPNCSRIRLAISRISPRPLRPSSRCLVVPIYVSGRPCGTVWIMAHDATRHFDAEDVRLLTSLCRVCQRGAAGHVRPGDRADQPGAVRTRGADEDRSLWVTCRQRSVSNSRPALSAVPANGRSSACSRSCRQPRIPAIPMG